MISGGLWLWVQQAMFEGVFLAVAPSLNSTTTCCQARYDEFQWPHACKGMERLPVERRNAGNARQTRKDQWKQPAAGSLVDVHAG